MASLEKEFKDALLRQNQPIRADVVPIKGTIGPVVAKYEKKQKASTTLFGTLKGLFE